MARDLRAGAARGFGEAAPAAADFEHVVALLDLQRVEDQAVFRVLARFQRFGPARVAARRIGHRRIKPMLIERVAEIIMLGDVPPGAVHGIVPPQMPDPVDHALEEHLVAGAIERTSVLEIEADELRRIGAVPMAVEIGLRKSKRCPRDRRQDRPPIVERQIRIDPFARRAKRDGAARRQRQNERAFEFPRHEPLADGDNEAAERAFACASDICGHGVRAVFEIE